MNNQFDSITPEQNLHILTTMLRTPIEVIRGFAQILSARIQTNSIEHQAILSEINAISEAAERMKKLLNEAVESKVTYKPTKDLSATDIILELRSQLLAAGEKNDVYALEYLAVIFGLIREIANQKEIGDIYGILNNLGEAAVNFVRGTPWKSTIPSEGEIISALNRT